MLLLMAVMKMIMNQGGQDQSSPLFISVTTLSMKNIQDFWGEGDFVIILVPGVCEYHTSSSGRWAFAFNDKFSDNLFFSLLLFQRLFPNSQIFYCIFPFFTSNFFLSNFHFSFYISSDFPRGPHTSLESAPDLIRRTQLPPKCFCRKLHRMQW